MPQDTKSDSQQYTVILFNHVCRDGVGDFSHLADIYSELKKKYPSVRIIPVINCAKEQFQAIAATIKKLGWDKEVEYYFDMDGDIVPSAPLRAKLKEADQVFVISHLGFSLTSYEAYLKEDVVCKVIGEHEAHPDDFNVYRRGHPRPSRFTWTQCSLGLSDNHYGIKLEQNLPRLRPEQALACIEKYDKPFYDELLRLANVQSAAEFTEKYELMPAYFNRGNWFRPLKMITTQATEKIPLIYLSGQQVHDAQFDSVETKKEDKQTYQKGFVRVNGTLREVHTIHGMRLSEQSYKALYQQASVVGVSGDNTFEMAVSCGAFPFYLSTNLFIKRPTLLALCEIIKNCDNISGKLKDEYVRYFTAISDVNFDEDFEKMNFKDLINNWHFVIDVLHKNYNFYQYLDSIFAHDAPNAPKPVQPDIKTVPNVTSGYGLFDSHSTPSLSDQSPGDAQNLKH